jgi:hypothetical protein
MSISIILGKANIVYIATSTDAVHITGLQSHVILYRMEECWTSSQVGGQNFLILGSNDKTLIISQETESSEIKL